MAENHPNLLKNPKGKQQRNGLLRPTTVNQLKSSLPCNVNSGESARDFLEEAKRSKEMKNKDYTVVDIEQERLIENDQLARGYEERLIDGGNSSRGGSSTPLETHIVTATPKYTSKATLHISNRASNVDDPIPITDLDNAIDSKKPLDANALAKVVQHSKYQVIIPTYPVKSVNAAVNSGEEKKVDENGNAVHQTQTKEKKKKKQSDKNVVVLKSENIEGHQSDIINNVDKLLNYIEGTENNIKKTVQSKSKQLHKQHTSEDGGSRAGKKKHAKSPGKDNGSTMDGRHELKKSNSLSEISGLKLDREFNAFSGSKHKQEKEEEIVVLRGNKSSVDRVRERRSWGNVEAHSFSQNLYNASSLENIETSTDNWEVTRPKKKSKKRRNSVSSASGARQNSSASGVSSTVSNEDRRSQRAPSPDLHVIVGVSNAKTTRSVPHSEKSNDSSSDVDSVHSLPIDSPISYADIAKNSEKKKTSPEKQERPVIASKEKSPQPVKQSEQDLKSNQTNPVVEKSNKEVPKIEVPDVHNIKSFPAITGPSTKNSVVSVITTTAILQNVTTSDKAVQSTLSYEDHVVVSQKSVPIETVSSTVENVVTVANKKSATTKEKRGKTVGVPKEVVPQHIYQKDVFPQQSHTNDRVPQQTNPKEVLQQDHPKEAFPQQNSSHEVFPLQNHTVQGFFGAQVGDTELPVSKFLSQLMRDPAHYATQRMPKDIVDVSTIEKMQFMNCSGPTVNGVPITSFTSSTSTEVSLIETPSKLSALPSDSSTPHGAGTKGKRKKNGTGTPKFSYGGDTKEDTNSTKEETTYAKEVVEENIAVVETIASVCDTFSEDNHDYERIVNGISDDVSFMLPETNIDEPPPCLCDSPPPVVILSGLPKEVPSGLIFGFDINEQLLLEDSGGGGDDMLPPTLQQLPNSTVVFSGQQFSENKISEFNVERLPCRGDELCSRYRLHILESKPLKHNHDKIVSFITNAWESIVSQEVDYYSDGL